MCTQYILAGPRKCDFRSSSFSLALQIHARHDGRSLYALWLVCVFGIILWSSMHSWQLRSRIAWSFNPFDAQPEAGLCSQDCGGDSLQKHAARVKKCCWVILGHVQCIPSPHTLFRSCKLKFRAVTTLSSSSDFQHIRNKRWDNYFELRTQARSRWLANPAFWRSALFVAKQVILNSLHPLSTFSHCALLFTTQWKIGRFSMSSGLVHCAIEKDQKDPLQQLTGMKRL